jgi:hypothetical protein
MAATLILVLRKLLPYGVAIGLVGGALYGAYRHGVNVTSAKYDARIAEQAKANAERLAALQAQARQAEHGAADRQAAIDQDSQEKLQNEIAARDRTIAGMRSGSIRLRQRFTCAGSIQHMPLASSDASGSTASSGGLQEQDAEFLVSESGRADEVAVKLNQCIATLRNWRALFGVTAK